MRILNIVKSGTASLRITTDEVLPNGKRYVDLRTEYLAHTKAKEVESMMQVSVLLKEAVQEVNNA